MSRFFASGGQSIGASASGSVLLINIQDLFPLGWTVGTPCGPRDSQEFLHHHSSKASILQRSAFFMIQLSNPYMTTGKTIALTIETSVSKVMSLLFNVLSRFYSKLFFSSNSFSKEQVSFNFMAAVIVCSDFGALKYKMALLPLSPLLFVMK